MDFKQILDAYIDEYYVREDIGINFEDDTTVRLELPDRIIHLHCDTRGIVSSKTHKRRGIPFSDYPVGIRRITEDVKEASAPIPENLEPVVQDHDKTSEIDGQMSIADIIDISEPARETSKGFISEGSIVCSIYCPSLVFRVKEQMGNVARVFDEKTSTSHLIAVSDLSLYS